MRYKHYDTNCCKFYGWLLQKTDLKSLNAIDSLQKCELQMKRPRFVRYAKKSYYSQFSINDRKFYLTSNLLLYSGFFPSSSSSSSLSSFVSNGKRDYLPFQIIQNETNRIESGQRSISEKKSMHLTCN